MIKPTIRALSRSGLCCPVGGGPGGSRNLAELVVGEAVPAVAELSGEGPLADAFPACPGVLVDGGRVADRRGGGTVGGVRVGAACCRGACHGRGGRFGGEGERGPGRRGRGGRGGGGGVLAGHLEDEE